MELGDRRVDSPSEYKLRKRELTEDNHLITRPIPRIKDDILKTNRPGRKKKYTPTKLKNAINKYFEWCEDEDELPSIKGLMIHLGMYRDVFYKYAKYPETMEIVEHARMIIANWAEEDVYNTTGMAAGKLAYMKNVHTWADKLETKNENNNTTVQLDVATATKKIEMLAPRLLELLENSEVVKQIGKDSIEAEVVQDG